jgi:cytochrome c
VTWLSFFADTELASDLPDMTWDDKSLDAFIADPQKAIPGNLMPFPGVADAKQRAEIIDYLKTVK